MQPSILYVKRRILIAERHSNMELENGAIMRPDFSAFKAKFCDTNDLDASLKGRNGKDYRLLIGSLVR